MYQSSQPQSQVLHPSQVVVTKEVVVEYPEENDFYYQQERTSYVKYVKNVGIFEILVAVTSVSLAGFLVSKDPRVWPIGLLIGTVAYLAQAILAVVWATKQQKSASTEGVNTQDKSDDNLTKSVFISGVVLAGLAFFLFVNLHAQFNSPIHYIEAREATQDDKNLLVGILIAQGAFIIFHFFFSLLTARATFRAIKMSNEAMSYAVYLGVTLLFIFALGLTFTVQKLGLPYDNNYTALQTNFPIWILKGLFVLAVALTVLAVIGYLINQRRWRVGYFALAFLLLVALVLLTHFTGYAYRQRKVVYNYYADSNKYYERLYNVNMNDIQSYGCPNKYVDNSGSTTYSIWEDKSQTAKKYLNPNCIGLLADLYSDAYLLIANFALLSLLAATLVSIGCYFFWYVSWLNVPPHHKREFFWIGLIGAATIAYIVCLVVVSPHLIAEKPTA